MADPLACMSGARWQVEGQKARLADAAVDVSIDLAHPELGLSLVLHDGPNAEVQLSVLGFALGDARDRGPPEVDAYARQNDLIATFERTGPRPMRAQVYWRWLEPIDFAPSFRDRALIAFDLIASVNTSLLDANPASTVRSSIRSASALLNLVQSKATGLQALEIGAATGSQDAALVKRIARSDPSTGCFIARLADVRTSWVEMVHPIDFRGSTATSAEDISPPRETVQPGKATARRSVPATLSHDLFEQRLEKGVILRARIRGALVKQESDIDCAMAALGGFSAAEPPLTV